VELIILLSLKIAENYNSL